MINYGKQYIDNEDREAVEEVLKSDWLTTGPKVGEFETELCKLTGYNYAVAVNSGTSALHCVLFAAGIKKGDEVILPAMTFIATANSVLYCGGTPVFADIDKDTLLIDIHNIEKLITSKTKAIIAVDYAGQSCDYVKLRKLCDKYNLILISDACQSLGCILAITGNKIADFTCYSFHPVKTITTGEGGAILCDDKGNADKMRALRNHGRYDGKAMHIGYNYRMSDINAALGISQLKNIVSFIIRRIQIAKKYDEKLSYCNIKDMGISNVYHIYVIKVTDRDNFIKDMAYHGIQCTIHYIPVYDHQFYIDYREKAIKNCINTQAIKNQIVSIPIYYTLKDEQVDMIIELVRRFNPLENEKYISKKQATDNK